MPDNITLNTTSNITAADAAHIPQEVQQLAAKVKIDLVQRLKKKECPYTYFPNRVDQANINMWKLADALIRNAANRQLGNISKINNFEDYCAKLAVDAKAASKSGGYYMIFSNRHGYPYVNNAEKNFIDSFVANGDRGTINRILNNLKGGSDYDKQAKSFNNALNALTSVNSGSTATADIPLLEDGLRERTRYFNNVLPRNSMDCPNSDIDNMLRQALLEVGKKAKQGSPYFNTFIVTVVPKGSINGVEGGVKYGYLWTWLSDQNNGGISKSTLNTWRDIALRSNVSEKSAGIANGIDTSAGAQFDANGTYGSF